MIREATLLDMPRLAELGGAYVCEAQEHHKYPLDLSYAAMNAALYIDSPDACLFVAVDGTRTVGFFWGSLVRFPWSRVPIAMDSLLYVEPGFRGKLHGVQLVRRFEKWARARGAAEVAISVASGIAEERACALYERMGYRPVGYQFRKEL